MRQAIQLIIFFFLGLLVTTAIAQSQKQPVNDLLYQVIDSEGVAAAVAKYRALKKQGSGRYDLSQGQLNTLGYRLLNEGRNEAAVAIFKLNAKTYPNSINVWDSLGEGYFAVGDKKLAIRQYKKVLKMLESDTTLTPPAKNFFRNNAQTKLFNIEHFDPSSEADLRYVSFYGGVPAGKWDMQNIADFKDRERIKLSYSGNNLYRSPVPGNIEQTITGANAADVSTSFVGGDYRRFIERGVIADISDLWKEQEWDEVFPASFKRLATYKGKQYFIPMAYQWNPVWYRKDIFDKHGLTPPENWLELLDLCKQLNELGYTPFSIAVQQWPPPVARWFTTLNLRLNGPEFHEQVMRGEVSYTSERIRNVFNHWRELFLHDAFADSSYKNNYQTGIRDLVSGKAVMYNLGEWIFESLDEEQGLKLDFFPFPVINPDVTPAEIVHVYGAFMRADNSNSETLEALLKWLASTESQQSNVEVNNRIVAGMDVDQSLYTDVQKRIINHINNTEVLVPLLEMNTHPEFARKALSIFQEYWEQPDHIDETIQKLEDARMEVFNAGQEAAQSSCMENDQRRQFDFWVGEWDVYVDGKKVSESRIERTLGGCMILENYVSLRYEYAGKSMNFYDAKLGKWVQIWTDTSGNISRYTGELRDGKMYFNGTNLSPDGKESFVRMEFIPNSDGSVRQIYEQSTDEGKTWNTLFDGTYRSKETQM